MARRARPGRGVDPTTRGGGRRTGAREGPVDAPRAVEVSTPEKIRATVLQALERRRRTRSELEATLHRKGFDVVQSAPILDRLTEVGLIDDLEYARVHLRRRAAAKPRGARLLRAELLGKGVPAEVADRALTEFRVETGDPLDAALRALEPILKRSAALEPRLRRQKAWQFLARRGFSGDIVERALRVAVRDTAGDEE